MIVFFLIMLIQGNCDDSALAEEVQPPAEGPTPRQVHDIERRVKSLMGAFKEKGVEVNPSLTEMLWGLLEVLRICFAHAFI